MIGVNEQAFYDRVGKINGWNFSHLKKTVKGDIWDFFERVKQYCKTSDCILDIGTGGGENLLKLASSVNKIIGIDTSKEMIEAARQNAQNFSRNKIDFLHMNSDNLDFQDDYFNIVTSRHCPFIAKEVKRVLKPGGVFLTQQVSERDAWNIKEAFGRGQSYYSRDGILKEQYFSNLKEAGFSKIEVEEYDVIVFYERVEDILFLLMHTPIIPEFGKYDNDQYILAKLVKDYITPYGIMTNEKRFMIIAQ